LLPYLARRSLLIAAGQLGAWKRRWRHWQSANKAKKNLKNESRAGRTRSALAEIFAFADGSNQTFGLPIQTLHVKETKEKKAAFSAPGPKLPLL